MSDIQDPNSISSFAYLHLPTQPPGIAILAHPMLTPSLEMYLVPLQNTSVSSFTTNVLFSLMVVSQWSIFYFLTALVMEVVALGSL